MHFTPRSLALLLQDYFSLARPLEGNPVIQRFAALAGELGVVLTGGRGARGPVETHVGASVCTGV